ncbi:MAG TPA: hypothetical protein DIS93_09795 [Bdellovibrionales bacterium]|nr:hypothetical protein [Bdellovibrionales bacterium]
MEDRMHFSKVLRFFPVLLLTSSLCGSFALAGITLPKPIKEWTFLTYINGNNNLDPYGATNINQMEQVGSTEQLNVIVQWASLQRGTTQRLYVQKDNEPRKVTSTVVQEIPKLDMGNWRSLVEFVRWAHDNYPAKRYFVNVWNHGNGWHLTDISYDDVSGNMITTKQLGDALRESSEIIGHKVDLYASDACLMAMVEIANEMKNSVEIFAGSEETEPGDGWPYHAILGRWIQNPEASATDVAKIITAEYVKSYTNGSNGNAAVTFSAFDLSKIEPLNDSIRNLGQFLISTDKDSRAKALAAANKTLHFTYSDYSDLGVYLDELEKVNLVSMRPEILNNVRDRISDFVVANQVTGRYARAKGVSIWIPLNQTAYLKNSDKYHALQFQADTDWGTTLKFLTEK